MNAKISVFVICVEAIIYLLLYNLHDCSFKAHTLNDLQIISYENWFHESSIQFAAVLSGGGCYPTEVCCSYKERNICKYFIKEVTREEHKEPKFWIWYYYYYCNKLCDKI